MAKNDRQLTFEKAVQWFRDHQFELSNSLEARDRVLLMKATCSATIEKAPGGGVKIVAYPGCLVNGEISKLVNRGYQQFMKTSKTELPATADKLKALQSFINEFKEGLGLPHLYNESLGTTSEGCVYDRVKDRELPLSQRPSRPWQEDRVRNGV